MKIEDQVLSIEQIKELQELGFDVEKYASMYFVPNWITKYGIDEIQDYLLAIGELGDDYEGDCIPTMTIGDIIEVLPEKIHKNYPLEMSKNYVYYCDNGVFINGEVEFKLIDALFEMLKWCIKEKHIKL